LRVAHRLAGANFGAVFMPQVGQEVLVSFLGGVVDGPVVIGAVYNGQGTSDASGSLGWRHGRGQRQCACMVHRRHRFGGV
jgi:uncharacterized protein involved in type VI secretion and phage assembly